MSFDKRFYGIYLGLCVDNQDPENSQRIKLLVPQVLGGEFTEWASPCLPVIFNADHPDHKKHLASEVAALLQAHANHTDTLSTASGGSPAHTHSITLNLSHTNNHTGKTPDSANFLDHEHETDYDADKKWNDASGTAFDDAADLKEHTPHRGVPNLDQQVWVMFIAGDPNFPVWMGVLS
ncbi:hypothetical protein UFOVP696_41 [uncultured Caudovirales phage]|jgi:hypothetical protein|uniref:Uncharacterized protein n=1 Tax=uncultured Caudovirales phage TaxID=2100421 RepID=A0A6J5MT07_9CAUD|nr:hypothetical protein UFOVP429_126 [uncultured Caudovirales phage]CAB4158173.1 hypothetical protein UFOVP696_41 [uncultured Caudovirales phage]